MTVFLFLNNIQPTETRLFLDDLKKSIIKIKFGLQINLLNELRTFYIAFPLKKDQVCVSKLYTVYVLSKQLWHCLHQSERKGVTRPTATTLFH